MVNNVAVIISLYKNDNPDFYKKALDSILEQTIGTDSIRIYQAIDGEIPHQLEQIVDEYSSHFYKVVRITPNQGLANALNRLISILEDETYVFRMDSDDISRIDRFEKQIHFMNNNPDIGVLGMAISEFEENGNAKIRQYPLKNLDLRRNISKGSPVAHPTVCFRRIVLDQLGGYPTQYHLCEDIALWFKAFEQNILFANLKEVGLDFRQNRDFFKRRSLSKSIAEFKVYWNGIINLHGWSYGLVYPILRLLSRLLPKWFIKSLYRSKLRHILLSE